MNPQLEYPFDTLPAAGETRQIAPGVHWIRMPLPFALDHINLWLIEDGDGMAIVDTGYGVDSSREGGKPSSASSTSRSRRSSSPTATPTTSAWPSGWPKKPAPRSP